MSFIDTAGRSARLRTRAQNWAITIESAPRSVKKLLVHRHPLHVHDVSQHLGEGALGAGTGTGTRGRRHRRIMDG